MIMPRNRSWWPILLYGLATAVLMIGNKKPRRSGVFWSGLMERSDRSCYSVYFTAGTAADTRRNHERGEYLPPRHPRLQSPDPVIEACRFRLALQQAGIQHHR